MEEKKEELIRADISYCVKYIRFLSKLPLEAVLIQHFTMSFQKGDNSVKLDEAIARMLLKKEMSNKAEIFTVVNRSRYYKCIYAMNGLLEMAILKELVDLDILGVEFVSMESKDGKLYATFRILR